MQTTNNPVSITVERVDGHCAVNWRVVCSEHGEVPNWWKGVAYTYPFREDAARAAAHHHVDAHPTTEVR